MDLFVARSLFPILFLSMLFIPSLIKISLWLCISALIPTFSLHTNHFLSFLPVVLIPVSTVKAVIPFGVPADYLLKFRKNRSDDFPLSKKNPRKLIIKSHRLRCHDLLLINHILYFIQISVCCRAFNYSFLQVVFRSLVYFCSQINLLVAIWIFFSPSFLYIKKHCIC